MVDRVGESKRSPCSVRFFFSTKIFASLRLCVSPLLRGNARSLPGLMPGFVFAIVMATCFAARAEDRIQAELDRVAKMSLAEQQAWLKQLEQRAVRAALSWRVAGRRRPARETRQVAAAPKDGHVEGWQGDRGDNGPGEGGGPREGGGGCEAAGSENG